jgi:hypothetical protein
MMLRSFRSLAAALLVAFSLAGCATAWEPASLPLNAGPERTAECEAKGLAWTNSRPLTWQQLQIHPNLAARPDRVNTLITADGRTVGYCTRGCGCRTNDWRRVADGRADCPADARPVGMCVPVDAGEARPAEQVRAPAPITAPQTRIIAN